VIIETVAGDIESPDNPRDPIIGMNPTLSERTPFALSVSNRHKIVTPVEMGSVLSFDYRDGRKVHMLVCHEIGQGGWKDAGKYVRWCLDYLWYTAPERQYSVVHIGTGRIGKRDGADGAAIMTALAQSHLEMVLYQKPKSEEVVGQQAVRPVAVIHAFRLWQPSKGETLLTA
jgi:hypothetical protein